MSSCPHCGGELFGEPYGRFSDLPDEAVGVLQDFWRRGPQVEKGRQRWEPTVSAQLSWYMAQLKANGYTLEAIAAPLGITREGARQRVKKARPVHGVPDAPSPPRPPVVEPPPPPPPRPEIPDETRKRLRALQQTGATLRGGHNEAHPARRASEELTRLIVSLVEGGFTYREIAEPMGVQWRSVKARLRSHGYLPNFPSQRDYQGTRVDAPA